MSAVAVHGGLAQDASLASAATHLPHRSSTVGSDIDQEIADLEARLHAAKQRRQQQSASSQTPSTQAPQISQSVEQRLQLQQQQHFLFLLSDSALPLGSFAFSSGLESFLAHDKAAAVATLAAAANALPKGLKSGPAAFGAFLPLSITSYAHSSLPFVLSAHDAAIAVRAAAADLPSAPLALDTFTSTLAVLDDTFDATIICTVGRRASVAQGRALLSVWERAFAPVLAASMPQDPLRPFSLLVKRSSNPPPGTLSDASAHIPPLFGAVAAFAGLDRRQTADVFILSHVKALVSAAVRANLLGPYQAQKLLASAHVQKLVVQAVEGAWSVAVEDAGQTMPVVDLWMGRHEMLYSRIFNS
ncbi:urease accessory protein [Ophiostoma piceae UAMH 11346]|uniref:Urease accessory protein n=1 Tax=Ophiostoma piceae (strain UAMH 11346) TaxID=1262450 RepID=S3CXS8_OPHP1|nr:urease accessory protein [Ophiostoma piceae UAMH 11346]